MALARGVGVLAAPGANDFRNVGDGRLGLLDPTAARQAVGAGVQGDHEFGTHLLDALDPGVLKRDQLGDVLAQEALDLLAAAK